MESRAVADGDGWGRAGSAAALLRRGHGTDGISDLSQAVGGGIPPLPQHAPARNSF